jgi:NAD(P)-dependent dehydrogenase (short-subunit alcohol dehydrogenase family)
MSAPVLILGATGGVGQALTRGLAARRIPLFLAARSRAKLAVLARETGARHDACDVLDGPSFDRVVEQAAAEGGLAGLAYCVGSIVIKSLRSFREEDFIKAYRLNVVGAALAVKAAQRALEAANGSVVLFSTVAVGQGFPNHAVISAAKGGVEGLTRALAAELAPKVRVNAVAPSLTRTPLAENLVRNEAMAKGIAQLHAIPRLGEPDDIAAAAAFLLGPDSGWITGQVMAVDGGRSRVRTKG